MDNQGVTEKREHRILRRRLQELVDMIELTHGELVLTAHDRVVTKVDITRSLCFEPNHPSQAQNWRAKVSSGRIRSFVRSKLQGLVVTPVGGFGYVSVEVSGGQVGDLEFTFKDKELA